MNDKDGQSDKTASVSVTQEIIPVSQPSLSQQHQLLVQAASMQAQTQMHQQTIQEVKTGIGAVFIAKGPL